MRRYIIKRIAFFIPTVFLILLVNFAVLEWMPGGPMQYIEGVLAETCLDEGLPDISGQVILPQELKKELEENLALDKPRWQRFLFMLKNYLTFDLGTSYRTGRSVLSMILERLPNTMSVGFLAFLLVYALAIPLGMMQAYVQNGFMRLVKAAVLMLFATPIVVLGLVVLLCFSAGYITDYFPSGGMRSLNELNDSFLQNLRDTLWHLALPVLTLVLSSLAKPAYLICSSVMTEMKKSYVYAALARGLSKKEVLRKHICKNSLVPLLGYMPGHLGAMLLQKPFFVEIIFSFGGVGTLVMQAFEARDYSVIFGTLYILSFLKVFLYLVGDVIVTIVDPRVHFEEVTR